MSKRGDTWVGADPGGIESFGVALLTPDGATRTWSVNCADDAVEIVLNHIDGVPAGVGVDAPLWWSSGPAGSRKADEWLRNEHRLSGGEVQAINSLRGAALVQGALFAAGMRQHFPEVPVTETHPKAAVKALGLGWQAFFDFFATQGVTWSNDHERDALVSAVAAREGFEGRWRHDLSSDRYDFEQAPSSHWLGPVHYFWPL